MFGRDHTEVIEDFLQKQFSEEQAGARSQISGIPERAHCERERRQIQMWEMFDRVWADSCCRGVGTSSVFIPPKKEIVEVVTACESNERFLRVTELDNIHELKEQSPKGSRGNLQSMECRLWGGLEID